MRQRRQPYFDHTRIQWQSGDTTAHPPRLRCSIGYKDPANPKEEHSLYYHIGHCLGPCNNSISEEEYAQVIRDVILFLEGRQEKLLKELQHRWKQLPRSCYLKKQPGPRPDTGSPADHRTAEDNLDCNGRPDVVAIVTDNGNAVAQMFFIRNGKLIGQSNLCSKEHLVTICPKVFRSS